MKTEKTDTYFCLLKKEKWIAIYFYFVSDKMSYMSS